MFYENIFMKKLPYSDNPINKALDRAIKDRNISNEDVVKALGDYTAAAIGNYRRGLREVPTNLVLKWNEVYGESLMPETFVLTSKTYVPRGTETNVSVRENVNPSDEDFSNEDWYKKTIDTLIHQNGETIGEFRKRDEKEIVWLRDMLATQIKPPNNGQ